MAMTQQERDDFRDRVIQHAQDVIAKSNRQRYLNKAAMIRSNAEGREGETAMQLMAEATRYELFADMLRDPKHSMWERIALDKLKNPQPGPIRKRRPIQYIRDTTLGYQRVAGVIHHPQAARLFFK